VTFDSEEGVPEADLDLWKREGLPLAGADAYPVPFGVTEAGKIMRPHPDQLTLMEAMLRIFASATEAEMRGRVIVRMVAGFGGETRYRLNAGIRFDELRAEDA